MEIEPKEFNDVTLYVPGFWGNIERVDARTARVWVGPYAQHNRYLQCICIEEGKRKPRSLDCHGYLVLVLSGDAIQPDELYLPISEGELSAPARYGISDPRWRTDFDEQLLSAKVPIHADYRNVVIEVELGPRTVHESESLTGQVPTLPVESAAGNPNSGSRDEFEEGVRYEVERRFFQRNPQLVRRAKEVSGCTCRTCGFDFSKAYGAIGVGFAEMHHLNPLSERPEAEWTASLMTSITEVAVLCSNCHRIIHRRKPALSLEELTAIITAQVKTE